MGTQANTRRTRTLLVALAAALAVAAAAPATGRAANPCAPPVTNAVACENTKPGTPPSDWMTTQSGDETIQGYATAMSVSPGETLNFKIKTPARSYHIDILRLGYYQGDGARKITAGLRPSATLPQTQPSCLTDASTGLVDCGNWQVSASWTVPADAVSGVYIAHLVRDDTGGDSQIPFVVRNDSSHSDVVVQTSDATWQAYNHYGGNSLYDCAVACPPGTPHGYKAAYAVSYNRPFDNLSSTENFFYAEYQLVRFLEENGYDTSYVSSADVERHGDLLKNHRLFISSGHDEYWSAGMRQAVEAARDAGTNLAFFSGNEMFWKTRWAPSEDGASTPYRTLVTYKDTHFDSPVDPQFPTTTTGSWMDPRFSPPGDAGRPQNELTGQLFKVNRGTSDIAVPARYAKLRFWRDTAVARLAAGQTLTLSPGTGTLGYEWDADVDNGHRPAGLFDLSQTTVTGTENFLDYGTTTANNSTATHNLTLYRAPSGALIFGAGTVQWSWGLDTTNGWDSPETNPSGNPPDPNIQQATVNLFADMGVFPTSLLPSLTPATRSSDATAPTSTITAPSAGTSANDGSRMTVSGTSTDAGGVVAGVEVSTDGGRTWHPAAGTTGAPTMNWTYSWTAHGYPQATIKVRAVDDSGNLETPAAARTVDIACPCTLWSNETPDTPDSGDTGSIEIGMKFRSDVDGLITGLRFYKSTANTGTHVGTLWTAGGTKLASVTFSNESSSGWQQATFSAPVKITAGTTYVASYFAPNGHYAATGGFFYSYQPFGLSDFDSPPLHGIDATSGNGLYQYSSTSTFPTSTYDGAHYWVDVVFAPATPPGPVTGVTATAGVGSATVSWNAPASGGPPASYKVTPYVGGTAQPAKTVDASTTSTRITDLSAGQAYSFTVRASNDVGDGPESAPSAPVTPSAAVAPGAPTAVSATAGSGAARVSWSAPGDDGGASISRYTVTAHSAGGDGTPVSVDGTTTATRIGGLTNGTSYTFTVTATNAAGTGPASAPSPAVVPQPTLFENATPATPDAGDPSPVELGVKFHSDVAGEITAIRFYKSQANTGTHIGSLWTTNGTRLASVTFTNETASGWQEATLDQPVKIDAGTTYIASYFAPNGHYAATGGYFATATDTPPLHAPADSPTTPNGVYSYTPASTLPLSSFNAANYWVDVVFSPAT